MPQCSICSWETVINRHKPLRQDNLATVYPEIVKEYYKLLREHERGMHRFESALQE